MSVLTNPSYCLDFVEFYICFNLQLCLGERNSEINALQVVNPEIYCSLGLTFGGGSIGNKCFGGWLGAQGLPET